MSPEQDSQPLLRKSYLIILGLAIVVMLIINPRFLSYLGGLMPDLGATKEKESKTGQEKKEGDLEAIWTDIEDFNHWIEQADEAEIEIQVRNEYRITKLDDNPAQSDTVRFEVEKCDSKGNSDLDTHKLRSKLQLHCHPESEVSGQIRKVDKQDENNRFVVSIRTSGQGQLGLSVGGAPPEFYDLQVRSPWPVPVSGTSLSKDGWIAAVGPRILREGDDIRPSEGLCGYQVLSISRRCVWFAAYYKESPKRYLHGIDWPDLKGVRVGSGNESQPERLELRSNCFLRPGDAILFKRTNSRMILDRLWPNAAKFRYELAESSQTDRMLALLCVIVRAH